jgi:hypothetical protein
MFITKWIFKILSEKVVCQKLLHNKYLKIKTLSQVQEKPSKSPFLKGIMGLKHDLFNQGSFSVGDGNNNMFWEDVWLGGFTTL